MSQNRGSLARLLFVVAVWSLVFPAVGRADTEIARRWATTAPAINGVIAPGEWAAAKLTSLTAMRRLRTMNDGSFLYILLDVGDDIVNDPIGVVGGEEFYSLAFDVDLNHAVTPHVDLDYDACQDGRPFVKSFYLGAHTFTGCQNTSPLSLGVPGFGTTLDFPAVAHRFWEFRLDFAEIGFDPTTCFTSSGELPRVRVNVGVSSEHPAFSAAYPDPALFPDLTDTFQIDLACFPAFPPGSTGPTFFGVGLVPTSFIDPLGYADLSISGYYAAMEAPFGGHLNVFGNWFGLFAAGARKYRVIYTKDGGPPTRLLQTWTNFRYNPVTLNWDAVAIGPDAEDKYALQPIALWYLPNLLVTWQTSLFGDGTYTLRLELFDAANLPMPAPPGNSLTLFVDNTPPVPTINEVRYNDAPVCACAIVTQGDDPSGFNFDVSVTDARGALKDFSLGGIFGNNQGTPTIYSDAYSPGHLNEDGPHRWNGVSGLVVPTVGRFRVDDPCAYSFILSASSRIQNGYGLVFPHLEYHVSLTILLGGGAGSVEGCAGGAALPFGEPGLSGMSSSSNSIHLPSGLPSQRGDQ